MIFISHYDSPLGLIEIAAGEDGLKGVWFEGTAGESMGEDSKRAKGQKSHLTKVKK